MGGSTATLLAYLCGLLYEGSAGPVSCTLWSSALSAKVRAPATFPHSF